MKESKTPNINTYTFQYLVLNRTQSLEPAEAEPTEKYHHRQEQSHNGEDRDTTQVVCMERKQHCILVTYID
jgi:hypothetical protein